MKSISNTVQVTRLLNVTFGNFRFCIRATLRRAAGAGQTKNKVIPRPHINLIIYHGVLAPNAKLRKQVVKYGRESDSEPKTKETEEQENTKPKHYKWAELMKRVFDLDVLCCPKCSGRLQLISLIEDPPVIKKILKHLGLPTELPTPSPARSPPEPEQLDLWAE